MNDRYTKTCDTEGCEDPAFRLGLCRRHRSELSPEAAVARRAIRARVAVPKPPRVNESRKGRVCRIEGCGRPVHAKSLCHSCYKVHAVRKPCETPGCPGKRHAQGRCASCYGKAYTAGVLSVVRPLGRDIDERFDSNVVERGSCRVWTGHTDANGRGKFTPEGGISTQVHRFSYKRAHGEIPVDDNGRTLSLDHHCRVGSCVNPDHLEPVTPLENSHRGLVAAGYRNITERDTRWFFTALRAFVEGNRNFPERVTTLHSRVTVWQVAS